MKRSYVLLFLACGILGASALAYAEKAPCKCDGSDKEEVLYEVKSVQGDASSKPSSVSYYCLGGGTGVFTLNGDDGQAWFDYQGGSYSRELQFEGYLTIDGKTCALYGTDSPAGTHIPRIRSFAFQISPNADGSYNVYWSWKQNNPGYVFSFCSAARYRLSKE
ncbi:MAG TPA: hypothetical protein VGJ26_09035 [Pirellulales bacterium]